MNQKKSGGASCAPEQTKFKSLQRGALGFLVSALIIVVMAAWCVNLTLSTSRRTKIRSAWDTTVHSVSTPQESTVDDEATTMWKSWTDRGRRGVAPTGMLHKEFYNVTSYRDLPEPFDAIEEEYMQQQNESQKQQQKKKLAGTIKGTMTAQHTKDLNTRTVKVTVTLQRCDKKGQHCKEFASASFSLNRIRFVEYWLGSTSSGSTDATGTSAGFKYPYTPCMATDTQLFFIPDCGNNKIRKADSGGVVTTFMHGVPMLMVNPFGVHPGNEASPRGVTPFGASLRSACASTPSSPAERSLRSAARPRVVDRGSPAVVSTCNRSPRLSERQSGCGRTTTANSWEPRVVVQPDPTRDGLASPNNQGPYRVPHTLTTFTHHITASRSTGTHRIATVPPPRRPWMRPSPRGDRPQAGAL